MTMLSFLNCLYEYHYWANERIMRAAEKVNDVQFLATTDTRWSLRKTLVHAMSAEWIWLSRWRGVSPKAGLNENDFPTLESIRARWRTGEQDMRAFLAALSDDELQRVVQYMNTRGQPFEFPLWQLMAHIVNHGTQHRSEAAALLTDWGYSPGDMDLSLFLTERSGQ
jgi:uncharacterized damage-inducible protein DinB